MTECIPGGREQERSRRVHISGAKAFKKPASPLQTLSLLSFWRDEEADKAPGKTETQDVENTVENSRLEIKTGASSVHTKSNGSR